MKFRALGLAAIAVAMSAIPASAHHSFAMFDAAKTVKLEGTVKDFQRTNPHRWILIMVRDEQGQTDQWTIEMGSPSNLVKLGWLPKTLAPGMKVTAVIHPLKSGARGGQYMAVTLPDGKVMAMTGTGEAFGVAPGAGAAAGGNTR
jgi:hypothetical protein